MTIESERSHIYSIEHNNLSRDEVEVMILRLKMIYLFKDLIYHMRRSRREKKKKKNRYKKSALKYDSSER